MRIEKGVISSSQLMFMTAAFVQGSSLLVAFTYAIAKHDTWLVVLSGFALILPLIWVNVSLAQKFPGKNLVQIMDIVYGSFLGKLISAIYILFPFQLIAHNLGFIGEFFLTYMYPETPLTVILIMFVSVCIWAVRGGIEVISRISAITVVITFIVVAVTSLLLYKEMEFNNFLPVFELSMKEFIQGTHIMMAIPYGELVVFLMIIPYLNKIKQAKSSVFLGLIFGAATLLIITVTDIAALGVLATVMVSPALEAVRLIDIAKIITRMEMLVAVVLLITVFIKVCVTLYASVLGIAQLFRLRSYRPLVLPIGIISVSFTVLLFDHVSEPAIMGATIWPSHAFLYLPIPVLTLLIAKIRKLPQKHGGENK
ncbi:endospore germination permease [Paenibacillus sp. NEAU-GSW1]|uniref:GerAB/ArcD/ProY family transporter n=1 Tax=Paenibacillus sp. NEAU-GSW1 TaxID=2682486 RepID=UPI0012E1BD1F|nr:endospore germination permease [Paenibacillus sp. NEAU-GSW1]MUT68476.1 endospore germination permease [Paenibacillus sp. NEAU-GSW1]